MDSLGEVIRAMRLSGAVFLDAELTEPWRIVSQVDVEACSPRAPIPAALVAYHYVVEGTLGVCVGGGVERALQAGQLMVLPRNDEHVLGSSTRLPPTDIRPYLELPPTDSDAPARVRLGGGGATTRVLCGYLGLEDAQDPLVACLPSLLVLDVRGSTGAFVEGSMRHAIAEFSQGGPGMAVWMAQLAGLLFAEAIRKYAEQRPDECTGLLQGLRDPTVGKALALMHQSMSQPWTIETLASAAGTSRSVLGQRFADTVGISPMRYLRRRRLVRAAQRLAANSNTIAEVATEAGYDSEAAFSRGFKSEFDVAPSEYRRRRAARLKSDRP